MGKKLKGKASKDGNVTVIDFGEKHYGKMQKMVNKVLAEAGVGPKTGMGAARKPFLSLYETRRGIHGGGMNMNMGTIGKFAGGAAMGLVGNRAIVTFLPMVWEGVSPLTTNAVAAVAGLLPLAFKQNAMAVGVATPGTVILGAMIVDKVLQMISGPASATVQGRISGAVLSDARHKLASVQSRIHESSSLPRVMATAMA